MAGKILKAKLWDDEDKDPVAKWKKGVAEIGGEVLCGTPPSSRAQRIAAKCTQCHNSHSSLP